MVQAAAAFGERWPKLQDICKPVTAFFSTQNQFRYYAHCSQLDKSCYRSLLHLVDGGQDARSYKPTSPHTTLSQVSGTSEPSRLGLEGLISRHGASCLELTLLQTRNLYPEAEQSGGATAPEDPPGSASNIA
ncbi:hypothetical protein EVAR_73178_1 [Eumeta japonica]|uniref:Uncharacterized protein n=1 Tax=Eumeta variegata TaxID=151549 RepID=A0A4C1S9J2_EUMVA|nr:hypothetical protein EVAR_73178_1 [Eumeta japonica]